MVQKFAALDWVAPDPIADHLRRHLMRFKNFAADQFLTDGAIGLAIASAISHTEGCTIGQLDPARPLDLKEKKLHCIINPRDFKTAPL
jgi:hypothetical protein